MREPTPIADEDLALAHAPVVELLAAMARVAPGVNPPPPFIAHRVNAVVPGFWIEWERAIRGALDGLDVTVTSWWREAAHNADVGGAGQSQHLIGTAMDLSGPDELEALARLQRLGFYGMRHRVPGGRFHVHVQAWRAGVARAAGLL